MVLSVIDITQRGDVFLVVVLLVQYVLLHQSIRRGATAEEVLLGSIPESDSVIGFFDQELLSQAPEKLLVMEAGFVLGWWQ